MKKTVFFILTFLAAVAWGETSSVPVAPFLPAQEGKEAPITVQHPQENMKMTPRATHIYLFGKLNLSRPTLTINGQETPVEKNGTFIAYVPVEIGNFELLLTAQSGGKTYQAVRHITVPGVPAEQLTDKARFEEHTLFPQKPVWALPGDTVQLSVRATPGAHVWAALVRLKNGKKIELKESANAPGLYQAQYTISPHEKPRTVKVLYYLQDPKTNTQAHATAKQRIKILPPDEPLQPARVKDPGIKLRQLPVRTGSLYPFYRAFGEVLISGKQNGLYRLQLGNGEIAWIEQEKLATTSVSSYHPNQLSEIETQVLPTATQVRWSGRKQVPVSVHEFSNRMEITFYYTPDFEENFSFDATSPLIDRIEWKEAQDGVLPFVIYFKPDARLWGHGYHYQENDFVLDLYHTPDTSPQRRKPLAGARILLDAGHSPKRTPPYDGLVSPSGFLEYEANLALAEVLQTKLEKAGATVIMTRQGDNHMSLPQRYQKALDEQAHIFVSLHHNALPDTDNPMAAPRGYSIYYTYPHSFALAQSVYQSFNKRISLPDNGLIANDILFIPRISEMPSILIENAFMILPEQEKLVMSPKGREQFAQAIYEGLLQFYKELNAAK